MQIAIDIDEVLADFMSALIKFHNDIYDTSIKKSDFFSYKFWKVWGGTREEAIQKVYDFYQTFYFKNIKPIDGAVNAIKKLKMNNNLFIITARPDIIAKETTQWVEKYFKNMFSNIYFTNHYSKNGICRKKSDYCNTLNIDILIEDSPDYAKECYKIGRKIILFKYPWNENTKIEGIYKVSNWNEVLKIIK